MLKRFINQFPIPAIERNEGDSIGEFSVSSLKCVFNILYIEIICAVAIL